MSRPARIPSGFIVIGLLLCTAACHELDFDSLASETTGKDLILEEDSLAIWPQDLTHLSLGLIPFMDRSELEAAYAPLLDHLGRRLGVKVDLVLADSYADLGRRMRNQEIDLGLFSALSYVQAKKADPGLRLTLKQVAEGSGTYIGYVYCLDDVPAQSILDLRGHSICWVDPQSTSGYLYPRLLLKRAGQDPDNFFSSNIFGTNHMDCLERVLTGEVDAGATYSTTFSIARDKGLPIHRLRILAKTPPIPFDAYCVRSQLPDKAAKRLTQELLRLSTRTPDGMRVLTNKMKLNAWVEAEDSDYDSVRAALFTVDGAAAREPQDPTSPE